MSHSHHPLNLIPYLHKVCVDLVGYGQTLIAVKEVVAVALGLGGSLTFERILNLGVVDDIDEICDKLLCLCHDVGEFIEA